MVKTAVYTGILSIICVAAKIMLLPHHGLLILAYVNIIVFGILFLTNYFLVKSVGYSDAINFKGILSIIILTATFAISIPLTYEATVFRFTLFIVLLILIATVANRNKEKLIAFASRFKKSGI